jgi:hypothetical protein
MEVDLAAANLWRLSLLSILRQSTPDCCKELAAGSCAVQQQELFDQPSTAF